MKHSLIESHYQVLHHNLSVRNLNWELISSKNWIEKICILWWQLSLNTIALSHDFTRLCSQQEIKICHTRFDVILTHSAGCVRIDKIISVDQHKLSFILSIWLEIKWKCWDRKSIWMNTQKIRQENWWRMWKKSRQKSSYVFFFFFSSYDE